MINSIFIKTSYLTDLLANLAPESEARLCSSAAVSAVSRALSDLRLASEAAAEADGCSRRGDSDIVRTRCWINCLTRSVSVWLTIWRQLDFLEVTVTISSIKVFRWKIRSYGSQKPFVSVQSCIAYILLYEQQLSNEAIELFIEPLY